MDKFNLMPTASQPVNRITNGQLPSELAELSEEALAGADAGAGAVLPAVGFVCDGGFCSYDGDDAE